MFLELDSVHKDVSLAKLNSWRLSGVAEYFATPKNTQQLQLILQAVPNELPITWLGLGSNVLIRPFVEGLVVHTRGLRQLEFDGTYVYAQAGVACAKLAKFCCKHDLMGGEFFAGIPGTVGGALAMNAGAFGTETWEVVAQAQTINQAGQVIHRDLTCFEVGYRSIKNKINPKEAFVGGLFQLPFKEGAGQKGIVRMKELLNKRNITQPIGSFNCGSVFTNPSGDHAARLIEACGLKGFQCGGAIISPKHANFIINSDHASSNDVEQLIKTAQTAVFEQFNIKLETEVRIIGQTRSVSRCQKA